MELPFDVAERLGFQSGGIEGPCAGKVPAALLNEVADAIDALSESSATARELKTEYEDKRLPAIRSSDDIVYLLVEGTDVLGFLRLGVRDIKVSAATGDSESQATSGGYAAFTSSLKDVRPSCLFDFFIVGGFERRGLGKQLFDAMLLGEGGLAPAKIAYSIRSEAMSSFLMKHFGLAEGKTVSLFTVYAGFFDESPALSKQAPPATPSSGSAAPKEVELDEPVIEDVEQLDGDPLKPYRVDEDEFYTQRVKLYCFNVDEWQDAGAGQVSLLRNTITGRVRLVFVQEVAKRVITNHFIVNRPGMCELQRHTAGNDKTWTWTAQERVLERRFAMKFKSTADAEKFQGEFNHVKRLFVESAAVEYAIIRKVGVTAEASLPSRHIKLLSVGATVNVVEVVYSAEQKRVRARLVQPPGWITILSHNTSDSASYAMACKDLKGYTDASSKIACGGCR